MPGVNISLFLSIASLLYRLTQGFSLILELTVWEKTVWPISLPEYTLPAPSSGIVAIMFIMPRLLWEAHYPNLVLYAFTAGTLSSDT